MFLVYLIKNICFLAFYFAFAALFVICPMDKSPMIVYLIILVCVSLIYAFNFNKKLNKLRYIAILGAISAIIYLGTVKGAIVIIFLIAYMIYIVKNDEYYVEYNVFKDLFIKLTITLVIITIIVFVIGWFDIFKRVSLPYIIAFFLSGLYLLRTSRHSKEVITSKIFSVINILTILITFAVCMVLSSEAAINAVFWFFKLVYNNICIPLLMGGVYIMMGIAWLFMKILSLFIKDSSTLESLTERMEIAEQVQDSVITTGGNQTYSMIFNIIAYALIILFCIILFKKFFAKRNKKVNDEIDGIRQYRSFIEDKDKVNKKVKQNLGKSINQIRHWYRKFLILCYRKNIDVGIFDSSQTIYDKSNKIFTEHKTELESITQIYRKARYSTKNIDSQEVKEIKDIYKKLENKKI